jgi:hypothetical protein
MDVAEEKKSHNMLLFNVRPQIKKNFCLIYIYIYIISCEEKVNIGKGCDRQSLYPMFLKCCHYLHPMAKS